VAYSWPVSLSDVRKQLNDTNASIDATELQTVIDAATGIVENLVGPINPTSYDEWYDGGNFIIPLRHYPVTAITSITEYTPTAQVLAAEPLDTTSTFTGYGYQLDAEAGVIRRTSGGNAYLFPTGRVHVIYQAGRAVVPAPVYDATLKLIQHMWGDQRGGSPANAVLGNSDFEQAPQTAHLVPWEVEEALAPYRLAPKVA